MSTKRILTFVLIFLTLSLDYCTAQSDGKIVDFERDVAPILAKRCMQCHGGDNPKGGFSVEKGPDLQSYIEPGDLSNSSLWADYLMADATAPDSLMMPPLSEGGRLPVSELAVLRTWIEDGADLPEVYQLGTESPSIVKGTPAVPLNSSTQRIWAFIGYFHPAIVHLPLGLLLAGAIMALLSFILGKRTEDFAYFCLLIGAPFAVLSAVVGWSFANELGYPGWRVIPTSEEGQVIFNHRWAGTAVAFLSVPLVFIAWLACRRSDRRASYVWRVGLIVLAALIGWVGHEGGEMTHKGLYEKAFERLSGTKELEEDTLPQQPPNFRMRASF